MPVIELTLNKADSKMKKKLIEELTKTASGITDIPEQSFVTFINELDSGNIGIGGKTLTEVLESH